MLSLLLVRRCDAGAVNVRRAHHEDAVTVAALLDEASTWVDDLGFSQWALPFLRDQIAAAIDRCEVYVVEAEDGAAFAPDTLLLDDPYCGDRPPDPFPVRRPAVRRDRAAR